jgi:hypothetical protein
MSKRQVFVLQPDIISHGILLSGYLIGCLVERFLGNCSPLVSLFLSLIDGLVLSLDFNAGQVGEVTEHGLQWCDFGCCVGPAIVYCCCDGEPFVPVVLCVRGEESQVLFNPLVLALCESVCLRMVRCTEVPLGLNRSD